MSEQMQRYKESLKEMSEPVMLSQMTKAVDLRGLMKYAKERALK